MLLNEEQVKLRALLTEAITVLCKNGLSFHSEVSVEGLLGITLDNQHVFLIPLNETIKPEEDDPPAALTIEPVEYVRQKQQGAHPTSTTARLGPGRHRHAQRKRTHEAANSAHSSSSSPLRISGVTSLKPSEEPPCKRVVDGEAAGDAPHSDDGEQQSARDVKLERRTSGEANNDNKNVSTATRSDKSNEQQSDITQPGFGDELNLKSEADSADSTDTATADTSNDMVTSNNSPRQRWVVDASNNVINIDVEDDDASSADETQENDLHSNQRLPCQPSLDKDNIVSIAAAAVAQVINKVDNAAAYNNVTSSEDNVRIIGDVTIPQDQSQLISLYSGEAQQGGEYSNNPSQGAATRLEEDLQYMCDICCREMKSAAALKYHKLHVHKIGYAGAENFGTSNLRRILPKGVYPTSLQVSKQTYSSPEVQRAMNKPVFPVPEVVQTRTLTKQGYSVAEDTYRCDDCNKTFRTSQGLKYHMMHHTGNYPYWCKECKKGFVVQTHYKEHQAKHEGTLFPCEHCSREFQTFSSLRIHKANHHSTITNKHTY